MPAIENWRKQPHYDPSLQVALKSTNPGNPIVLNQGFKRWSDDIIRHVRDRKDDGNERYEGAQRPLFLRCLDHASAHESFEPDRKNTLVLTHPFYMHLSDMNCAKTARQKKEAKEYADNLFAFLNSRDPRDDLNVVLLETAHHYAAATSLLLEQELVDKVIFTEYGNGDPLRQKEFIGSLGSNIFFGGSYNGMCLANPIYYAIKNWTADYAREMKEVSNIWAIKELVINPPFADTSLIPKKIKAYIYGDLPDSNVLSLEDACDMIGIHLRK